MNPLELILSLLDQDGPLTEEQMAQLTAAVAELSDDELLTAETEIATRFDTLSAGDEIDADILARLTAMADLTEAVRTEASDRYEAAEVAEAAAEAEALERQRILDELQTRMSGEGGDPDPDPAADPADPPADPADPADPDPEADPEGGDPATVVDPELEPVGAAAGARPGVASRADIRRHSQARTRPRPQQHQGRVTMRGAGGSAAPFETMGDVETELLQRWRDLEGTTDHGNFRVATFATEYPADHNLGAGRGFLDVQDRVDEIAARITEGAAAVEALVADGGICGPVDVWRGLTNISQASRPLRAAIASYQAKYGGLSWETPMSIADILTATTPTSGRAIGVVTEANDAASTYDKSFQTVACGTRVEKRIDAVYNQLKFGNFYDRTNPDGKSQFVDLSIAAYARFSEQRLFNAMAANSHQQTAPQNYGATRDLLTSLNRHCINRRAQYRMDPEARVDVVIPAWLGMGMLPDDQTNALQSYEAQFEVTKEDVARWLAQRNINVITWFQDDFTTALVNGASINAYPTNAHVLVFHPGAHVYIDGGELNLGVVRDQTHVSNNTFATFQEEFWTTGMWGVWSDDINFSLCESGASAGSVTPHCLAS